MFLNRNFPTFKIKEGNCTAILNIALHSVIQECEIKVRSHFLQDYSAIVSSLNENAITVLMSVFKECFARHTNLKSIFDIKDYVDKVGWSEWWVEYIINVGFPYAEYLNNCLKPSWSNFWSEFCEIVD